MHTTACSKCGLQLPADQIDARFGGNCPRCLAAAVAGGAPGEPLSPGTRFRGMKVLRVLGRGGMGVVYLARQEDLDRSVALKVLAPELAAEPDFVQRFRREAQALAALDHPGIVRVIDYGREMDVCFLAMEFVEGVSLRQQIESGGVPPKQALRLIPQICEALEYAHSRGVIHRDIKPENILVTREERVKIADFGLARIRGTEATRMTRTQDFMGTPGYMAPEQVESAKNVDHRADIYALGVIFYEMLTGALPIGRFELPSKRVVLDARIDRVVLKALERDPDKRYQHAAQVKSDVETVLATRATARKAAAPPRRRAGLVAAAIAVAVVAGGGLTWWRLSGSPPAPRPAGTSPRETPRTDGPSPASSGFAALERRLKEARTLRIHATAQGHRQELLVDGAKFRLRHWNDAGVLRGDVVCDGATVRDEAGTRRAAADIQNRIRLAVLATGLSGIGIAVKNNAFPIERGNLTLRPVTENGRSLEEWSGDFRLWQATYRFRLVLRDGVPIRRAQTIGRPGDSTEILEEYTEFRFDGNVDPEEFRLP